MKKVLSLLLSAAVALILSTCAFGEEPPPPDYPALMVRAAAAGDVEAGRALEEEQRAFLAEEGAEGEAVSFDELYLLARSISLRAGAPQLSDEFRLCAGEVLLNRVDSPEFPDTLEGVLLQLGRDCAALAGGSYEGPAPSEACAQAALELLSGRRMLDPTVVYQTGERKKEVVATFADKLLGFTYFCRSEHPELYEESAEG